MIVAFSGHRPEKLGGHGPFNDEKTRVISSVTKWLDAKYTSTSGLRCITGMALGFDQWATLACYGLGIPYEAAIPFEGQEARWTGNTVRNYQFLLRHAIKVHVVSPGGYANWKFQKRNEWMVNRGDLLLACWNGSSGGTANCVRYAREVGKTVERLEW